MVISPKDIRFLYFLHFKQNDLVSDISAMWREINEEWKKNFDIEMNMLQKWKTLLLQKSYKCSHISTSARLQPISCINIFIV